MESDSEHTYRRYMFWIEIFSFVGIFFSIFFDIFCQILEKYYMTSKCSYFIWPKYLIFPLKA